MNEQELAAVGLRYAVNGPVATLTLDRPEVRNAQTPAMWRAMAEIGGSVPDEVRVVVVYGAGHSFSAGLDRKVLDPAAATAGEETVAELLTMGADGFADRVDAYQRGFTWLRDTRFVSIAGVQGYALGAGFQLALSCDLRVAAEDAQFAMLEASLGLVPDLTGTKPLVECVGYARALEICATSRMVGATEAAGIGLVNTVVPPPDLHGTVARLTTALLAPPVGAVRDTKALLQEAAGRTLDEQRLAEHTAQYGRFRELAEG